jgi:hypothetical protein
LTHRIKTLQYLSRFQGCFFLNYILAMFAQHQCLEHLGLKANL